MKIYSRHTTPWIQLLPLLLLALLLHACANIGRPSGGARDKTPPRYLASTPLPNQLEYKGDKIEIYFDEIVQIKNPSEQVVISPPQKNMPAIQASGRKVTVTLKDSLLANTTYTIDFSNAIVDNNEGNVLEGFALSFSTGNVIDTLQVSGTLLQASNLEPITGMMVGIQSNLNDSAFNTLPFTRIAISDAYGRFTIRNVAEGTYRLFALKDANRDFAFDNPSEDIAMLDSLVTPWMEMKYHSDTLWVEHADFPDSLVVDSIYEELAPHYYPNNLLLRAFNENYKAQYLESNERKERNRLTLLFATAADSLPKFTPLNFNPQGAWYEVEKSATNDTLTYWLTDTLLLTQDTLRLAATYLRTDSLSKLSSFNDTLQFVYRAPRTSTSRWAAKKEEKDTLPPPITFLGITDKLSGTIEMNAIPQLLFNEPLLPFADSLIRLEEKVDTLWRPTPFSLLRDSNNIRRYTLSKVWSSGRTYRLSIDSAAIHSIYGLFNNKLEKEFSVRKVEEYSSLAVTVQGISEPSFVELLSSSDVPLRTTPVVDGVATFRFVKPGEYYLRLVVDSNENGSFDTGNYSEKLQPERVYYYPDKLKLKENWDVAQDWNPTALPVESQKPRALVKNKPKTETVESDEEEDEDDDFVSPFDSNF